MKTRIFLFLFFLTANLKAFTTVPFEVYDDPNDETLRIVEGKTSFVLEVDQDLSLELLKKDILDKFVSTVTPSYISESLLSDSEKSVYQTRIDFPCDVKRTLAGKNAFMEKTNVEMINKTIKNYYEKYIQDEDGFVFKREVMPFLNPDEHKDFFQNSQVKNNFLIGVYDKFSDFNQFAKMGHVLTLIQKESESTIRVTYVFKLGLDKNFMGIGDTKDRLKKVIFSIFGGFTVEKVMLGKLTFDKMTNVLKKIGLYDQEMNCTDSEGPTLMEGIPNLSQDYLEHLKSYLKSTF